MNLNPTTVNFFLEVLLIRNISKLEFKVCRKPTCKNDQIHFSSHHNNNYKTGVIISFYHWALRICSRNIQMMNFGLVSLFNGISTFVGYLMPNLNHSWEDKGVHTFPQGICPKVNVIARLEYELVYYDSAIHRFNHYTTRTPQMINLNAEKTLFLNLYTPNLLYTLLNLKPSTSTIRDNLELIPTHPPLKLSTLHQHHNKQLR